MSEHKVNDDGCGGARARQAAVVGLWRSIAALWLALLALQGCGGSAGTTSDVSQPSNQAVLMNGVQMLDAATQGSIIAADANSVTFGGAPPRAAALKPGDIFIAQQLARKVTSMQTVAGNTVAQTSSPELGEVYRTVQLAASVLLTEDMRVPTSAASRTRAMRELAQTMSVVSKDGQYTITLQEGVLAGTVVLDQPKVDLAFNFGTTAPAYASVHFKAGETFDLQLSVAGSTAAGPLDIPLLEFKVPIVVTGGTVELLLELTLHFEAAGNASISASVSQQSIVDAGIDATLSPYDVKVTNTSTSPTFTVSPPQFKGELSATAALQPAYKLQLLQFSLAGMENQLGARAAATETVNASGACERLVLSGLFSASFYVLVPQVALDGVSFTWDSFFDRLNNFSMKKVDVPLFEILSPIYDSSDVCIATNQPPVAVPGAGVNVASGAAVTLDGSASHDPDGRIVAYAWTQTAGPAVTLTGATAAIASFVAPTGPASLTFRLTVTDDGGATASGDVNITVGAAPPPSVPAAPVGVSAQAGDRQLQLTWSAVTGATSYNVYYATAPGVMPSNYATLPGGSKITGAAAPLTISSLANGLTYYLVVTAVNTAGESNASLEVSATPHATSGGPGAERHPTLALSLSAACVVLRDGTVRCWGSGPLGDGTTTQVLIGSATPVPVQGIASATELSAGRDHMCVLLADGTVRCWGSNQFRQLGDGTTSARANAPTQVSGLTGAVALASGDNFTCALLVDGTVRCWGDDQGQELGVPTPPGGFVDTPVQIPNIASPIAISAGGVRNCFVTSDNRVQCIQSAGPGGAPIPVDQGLSHAIALAVEASDNMCALLDDGSAACFGSNGVGQLGNGSTTLSQTPVVVSGLAGAAWISAGTFATHHCALLATGSLRCWGNNDSGQLGTGSFNSSAFSSTPQAVIGIGNAVTVAAAYRDTCAVLADGTVRCWGQRFWNGTDSALSTATPEAIGGITTAR
jgi:alpha-tubulin suppressor-like RCC1 family protein